MPLDKNQPVTKIVNPAVPAAGTIAWTLEMPQNINLGALLMQLTVTKSATGQATKTIPVVSDAVSLFQWKFNGTPQRARTYAELFGQSGLNGMNDKSLVGTVQYFQAGAAITAVLNGITYGNAPVLIGSAADIAIQGALANNTITVAVFGLPFLFSEDFRKSYKAALAMAVPTAFGDAQGRVTGNVGGAILELTMAAQPGGVNTVTNVTVAGNVEYDDTLAAAGSTIRLLKEKRLTKQYNGAGDVEMAEDIKNKAGEALQYVLLSATTDYITKVVVKQGDSIKRNFTWEDNILSLRKAGVNVDGITRSMFPIIWDRTDDPTTGLPMDPNKELSIVATIGVAAGQGGIVGTTMQIDTGIYGALEA